jgi:hypothetical protein
MILGKVPARTRRHDIRSAIYSLASGRVTDGTLEYAIIEAIANLPRVPRPMSFNRRRRRDPWWSSIPITYTIHPSWEDKDNG